MNKLSIVILAVFLAGCSRTVQTRQEMVICGGGGCRDRRLFYSINISPYECSTAECMFPDVNCKAPQADNENLKYCKEWCDVTGCGFSCGYCNKRNE